MSTIKKFYEPRDANYNQVSDISLFLDTDNQYLIPHLTAPEQTTSTLKNNYFNTMLLKMGVC